MQLHSGISWQSYGAPQGPTDPGMERCRERFTLWPGITRVSSDKSLTLDIRNGRGSQKKGGWHLVELLILLPLLQANHPNSKGMKSETRAAEMEFFFPLSPYFFFNFFLVFSTSLCISVYVWLLCGSQTDLSAPKKSSYSFICHQGQSGCCRSACPIPCCGSRLWILPARKMCQKSHFPTKKHCYKRYKITRG